MKKLSRLLAFSLAAVMLLCVIPFTASAASLSSMKVVAFGDSLTHYGDGWTSNYDEFGHQIATNSYPDLLSDLIGTEVYNAGVGGETTHYAMARIYREVINQNPDIVVICLGMNDQAINTDADANLNSVEAYRQNLSAYVELLRKAGAEPVFLTPSPACAEAGCAVGSAYNNGALPTYVNAMREVAVKYNCTYVDANYEYSVLSNLKDYYIHGDGVHQSYKGRSYFASLVAEHLKAVYENTNKATMTVICKDQDGNEIKRYTLIGAAGALITIPSPDLGGYTSLSADVATTFVNGATFTFNYSADAFAIAESISGVLATEMNTEVANRFFEFYKQCKILMSADVIDFEALEYCTENMKNLAVAESGTAEVILSNGASYTTTAPNYYQWDSVANKNSEELNYGFADNGVRLTDGNKAYKRGEDSRYSAWTSNVEIVVDLGEVMSANVFRGYFAGDEWGVKIPKSMTVAYKAAENDSWTNISASSVTAYSYRGIADKGDNIWSRATLTVSLSKAVKARYVKFSIPVNGYFVWTDEIEVALKTTAPGSRDGAIEAINTTAQSGKVNIYLGGYDLDNAGDLSKSAYAVARWDYTEGALMIIKTGNGDASGVTLGADDLLIAADSSSGADYTYISEAKVGQVLNLYRIDTSNGINVAATYTIDDCIILEEGGTGVKPGADPDPDPDPGETYKRLRGDVNNSGAIDMMDYVLLKRNYFGTFVFDEEQLAVADINNNGGIDMMDYVLLKRVYFGTFTISDDLKYVELTK